MLSCVLTDIKEHKISAPSPVSLSVDIEEGVPADALLAVFPYFEAEELCRVTLFSDGKVVFTGIVDEEEHLFDKTGEWLRISARSLAALLLDNEAMPCGYDHPSASLLYERYVAPYGIKWGGGDDATCFGEQAVAKGNSCWSVLRRFCLACYGTVPRVSADGALYMRGIRKDGRVTFGDRPGAVRYTSLTESVKRCEELSTVHVKTDNADHYSLPVVNADAVSRGIRRERYLNAVLTSSPMRCADAMLMNGAAKAYTVKLRAPACCLGIEGCAATLSGMIGEREDLYVSAVHYRLTTAGEYSDITLKRRVLPCG